MNDERLGGGINIVHVLFMLLGFISIAFFASVETALIVFVFLLEVVAFTYLLTYCFFVFSNKTTSKYLTQIVISSIICIVTGLSISFFYNATLLLKALSFSVLVFVIILGYMKLLKS
jgi:hypothetical protein